VLRYLNEKYILFSLTYKRSNHIRDAIEGFVDAKYTSYVDTRKFISRYIITLFGSTFSWKVNM